MPWVLRALMNQDLSFPGGKDKKIKTGALIFLSLPPGKLNLFKAQNRATILEI